MLKRSKGRIIKRAVFLQQNILFPTTKLNVREHKNEEIQRKWSTLNLRIILSQIYITV